MPMGGNVTKLQSKSEICCTENVIWEMILKQMDYIAVKRRKRLTIDQTTTKVKRCEECE